MTDATPEHLTTVAPRLVVGDGNAAMGFHREAFGAEPFATAGRLIHAVLRIGTGTILVTEEGEAPARSPEALGGRAGAIMATYWTTPTRSGNGRGLRASARRGTSG